MTVTETITSPSSALRSDDAKRVLVIDTDPGVRWALEKGLSRSGYEVIPAAGMADGLAAIAERAVEVVVLELRPEAGLSLEALSSFTSMVDAPQILCVSVDATPRTVMECMRRGAADFLTKPFSLAEVRDAVGKAAARAHSSGNGIEENKRGPGESALIGLSPSIQELRKLVAQAAKTDLNCLIRGQSGVGKDVVAREIHRLSTRNDKPFIKVNCTALPENLLESELFGFEKGAFTGADSSKLGRFSLADKGVIFLDEIGDMEPYVQAKILQVIEHKEFTKLGSGTPVKVDVQIIAATNANLEEKISQKLFRDDLFFRLNEVDIWVPPLAKRCEDIPLLVRHFLAKHSRPDQDPLEISGENLEQMINYEWPGNVRELESTIKRWLAIGKSTTMGSRHHANPEAVSVAKRKSAPPSTAPARAQARNRGESPPEPDAILAALEKCQWNRRKAAEALGMSYSALRRNIEKHELDKRRAL